MFFNDSKTLKEDCLFANYERDCSTLIPPRNFSSKAPGPWNNRLAEYDPIKVPASRIIRIAQLSHCGLPVMRVDARKIIVHNLDDSQPFRFFTIKRG